MTGPGDDLDVLVVSRYGGTVHRWDCDRAPHGRAVGWSPAMSGLDDRPCPTCLPGGLSGETTDEGATP